MKYYTYVSDSKIDMLYSQLPSKEARRISTELELNFGIVKASASKPELDSDLYSKLKVVVSYLKQKGLIGTVSKPKDYFAHKMKMHLGNVSFYKGDDSMILYSGVSEDGILVGLVGSSAHVVGAPSMESESLGYARAEFWLQIIEEMRSPSKEEYENEMYDLDNLIDYQARHRDDASKQSVEFVAKKFIVEGNFLIGSPLYVAMT